MRRLIGIVAFLAHVASPTVAQARLFCRYTGLEITDCEEQRVPDRPAIQSAGCCERRVVGALDAARIAGTDPILLGPALVVESVERIARASPLFAPEPRRVATGGPPLFLVQRALLI